MLWGEREQGAPSRLGHSQRELGHLGRGTVDGVVRLRLGWGWLGEKKLTVLLAQGGDRQRGATSASGSQVWACVLHFAQALTQQEVPLGSWVLPGEGHRAGELQPAQAVRPPPGCTWLQRPPGVSQEQGRGAVAVLSTHPAGPASHARSSQAGQGERSRTLWQKGFWSFEPLHHTQETEAAVPKATPEAGLRTTPNSVACFCIDWLAECSSPFQPSG